MQKNKINRDLVSYVSSLAKLSPSQKDANELKKQVESTIEYISDLSKIDTDNIPMTTQVGSLKNVFREDLIDKDRILNQTVALSNAKRKHNGFFVVKGIFEE